MQELPAPPEWIPVRSEALPGGGAPAFRCAEERDIFTAEFERRGQAAGGQAPRWSPEWPADTTPALLAATYAKGMGKCAAFSLAAFRQAYAGGRDLGERDNVLIACAACEIHPAAMIQALERPSIAQALDRATEEALAAGVRSVPAVLVGGRSFEGSGALDEATAAVGA